MHNIFFLNLRQKATGSLNHCGFCISWIVGFVCLFLFLPFFPFIRSLCWGSPRACKGQQIEYCPPTPSSLGGFSLKWNDFLGVVVLIHGFSYRGILHPSSLGYHFWMWCYQCLQRNHLNLNDCRVWCNTKEGGQACLWHCFLAWSSYNSVCDSIL